jgi:hypothetical protein
MPALHALTLIVGTALALAILGSALRTVVLPQGGFARLSQVVFATVHRLLVHDTRNTPRGKTMRAFYAPVALVSLPLVWMVLMAVAFTLIFWGTGSLTWQRAFEISGSSLTTLGFAEPDTTARIWIAFIEATIGLGLVALLISYLPTIYSAYNGREKGILRLRPVAGTPPTAVGLLQSLHRIGSLDDPEFWRNAADWLLDLEQTHTAFPILSYFPETRSDHSWVATVGTLLDASALVAASSETRGNEAFAQVEKGPLMMLVYGLPLSVRIAEAASVSLPPSTQMGDVISHFADPVPDISIDRSEYLAAMRAISTIIGVEPDQEDEGWRRFAWVRSSYDPALRALAGLTGAPPAPWTTDRPAKVGRPRFLRRRPLPVDWSPSPQAPEDLTGTITDG